MSNQPTIGDYLDDEERELIETIEQDDYQTSSILTEERLQDWQAMARAKMNEERAPISLRIPETDLSLLKSRAMKGVVGMRTHLKKHSHAQHRNRVKSYQK